MHKHKKLTENSVNFFYALQQKLQQNPATNRVMLIIIKDKNIATTGIYF